MKIKPSWQERAFVAFYTLTGFAGLVVLMLDLLVWRPN